FRQVGIATAVAALGSIFAHHLRSATAATLPVHYASALNDLLLIAAITALVAALIALPLIRPRDFVPHGPQPEQDEPAAAPEPARQAA
ncbi:MAG TPA: hypothetical protein VME01_07930, partial [Solirubrobacteraceae bacterium]|nr:hypothetical protein [Solirubrobacteraceae bacterium]